MFIYFARARARVPIAAALALTVLGWSLIWLVALFSSTWPVWPAVVLFVAGLALIPLQPGSSAGPREPP